MRPLDDSAPGGSAGPPGLAAARLTLLALRAYLSGGTRTSVTHVVLAPDATPQPVETVARRLAALPPPLRCRGTVRDGHLVLVVEPFPRPRGRPVKSMQFTTASAEPIVQYLPTDHWSIGTLGILTAERGPAADALPVVCVGADEAIRLTAGEFRAWERDYEFRDESGRHMGFAYAGMRFDPTVSPAERVELVRAHTVTQVAPELLAAAAGALVYIRTDDEPEVIDRLLPDESPALWCDDCGRRRAVNRIVTRADGVERERVLCAPCRVSRDVVLGVREPRVERILEMCMPNEETASADDCLSQTALLTRYAEKVGLPLAAMSYEWAAFVRRHPPEE